MKVQIKRKEKKFEPVTIELTFETEEGLGLFSQLFNYSPISSICDEFGQLWDELQTIRRNEGLNLFEKIKEALKN